MLTVIDEHLAWNHAAHLRPSHQMPASTTAMINSPNKSEACECGEDSPWPECAMACVAMYKLMKINGFNMRLSSAFCNI
jgi:hypothetical protein